MRNLLIVVFALVVTALLFVLMQALIKDRVHLVDETPAPPAVEVVDVPPEEVEPPDDPVDPPEPKPTPPGVPTDPIPVQPPEPVVVTYVQPTRSIPPVRTSIGNTGEGDPMPIAAVPPQYPRQALLAGIEGWVRVSFTIAADGTVSDAAVVDAHPRRGVFDEAALNAITRWRFEPRRDSDGEPVASRAGYTIAFKLTNDA